MLFRMLFFVLMLFVSSCSKSKSSSSQDQRDEFGKYIWNVGDLTGDGKAELAVTFERQGFKESLVIYDLVNKKSIFAFSGENGISGLGKKVMPFSDLDGDGTPEILIGSGDRVFGPLYKNTAKPGFYVFSYKKRRILTTYDFEEKPRYYGSDNFPKLCVVIKDLTQDGIDEILCEKPRTDYFESSKVVLLNGKTGSVYLTYDSAEKTLGYSPSIINLGDFDGDATHDYAIGCFGCSKNKANSGLITVYSGNQPGLKWEIGGENEDESMKLVGDFYGNFGGGSSHVVIVSRSSKVGDSYESALYFLDLKSASFLSKLDLEKAEYSYITGGAKLDDLNGDGVDDFVFFDAKGPEQPKSEPDEDYTVIREKYNYGQAFIISGADGKKIRKISGTVGSGFGNSFALVDDYDGDGKRELAFGQPGVYWKSNPGKIIIYSPAKDQNLFEITGDIK